MDIAFEFKDDSGDGDSAGEVVHAAFTCAHTGLEGASQLLDWREREGNKNTSFPLVYTGIFADTLMKSLNLIPLSFFLSVSSAFFNCTAGIR